MLKCTFSSAQEFSSYIPSQSCLCCLEERWKVSEILTSAAGSLAVCAQQALWYLEGEPCKECLMASEHQLWCKSFEGIWGAGVNAAIAVTHSATGCPLAWLCERLQVSRSREHSRSSHSAWAAEYIVVSCSYNTKPTSLFCSQTPLNFAGGHVHRIEGCWPAVLLLLILFLLTVLERSTGLQTEDWKHSYVLFYLLVSSSSQLAR